MKSRQKRSRRTIIYASGTGIARAHQYDTLKVIITKLSPLTMQHVDVDVKARKKIQGIGRIPLMGIILFSLLVGSE